MSSQAASAFVNKRAINYVLGAIIKEPALLRQYDIDCKDFPERFHRVIFAAVNNLADKGTENIDAADVDEYLSHYNAQHKTFNSGGGVEFVKWLISEAKTDNIKYYHDQLKKFSLLRGFVEHGIDVSEYFDPSEVDPDLIEQRRQRLDKESISDIITHFRKVQLEITAPFKRQESRDSKKVGENGLEQKEEWKKHLAWGIGYSSAYLTEILHGMRPKIYTVRSAGTGVGKTRTAIADIAYACSPSYYDPVKQVWAKNPNGVNNGALYIGTEMELAEEIDPIFWAYVANVPQDHIIFNEYAPGEEERVEQAIKLLKDDSNIWLEYLPEFNISMLESVIEEHVLKHDVRYVFFDYIHTTPALISEFQSRAKAHIALREDQILLELSSKLKQMARDYDVCINAATQVNAGYKDENNRDQSLVAGAKSIINKADNAMIAMPPTMNELELIRPILEEGIGGGQVPNLCYSVYKVRTGMWTKVKVWLYVDYSTMRIHDLFVTNYDYQLIRDIRKTYIDVEGEIMASRQKPFYGKQAGVPSAFENDDF